MSPKSPSLIGELVGQVRDQIEMLGIRGILAGIIVGGLVVLTLFIATYILTSPSRPKHAFSIFASLLPRDQNTLSLHGHVLRNGDPVSEASVWVILQDARGNRSSPNPSKTNAEGKFIIEPVPTTIAERAVEEVRIHAHRESPKPSSWYSSTPPPEDAEEVLIPGHGSLRRVQLSGWPLVTLPVVFFVSLLVALGGESSPFQYGFLTCVTFLLTVAMIVAISLGLSYVHTTSDKNDVLSLGYASLFQGRFVKDGNPEWLFSLTAAPELPRSDMSSKSADNGGQQPPPVHGFGAPLWVLLLAVVGAALRTILLLVNEIKNRPTFTAEKDVRERMELIVRHQFFILFAPLGAILIYQLLVIAEAATQPVIVALVSLGAGLTLTTLIDRAVALATTYAQGAGGNRPATNTYE